MLGFVIRRLAVSALLIAALLTLVFFLAHAAPGDPLQSYLRPDMDPAFIAQLRARFGFDQPLPVQYFKWMRSFLLDFDFGMSVSRQRPVRDLIAQSLPRTLQLAAWALLVRCVLGAVLGVIAAVRRGTAADTGLRLGALLFYSVPSFWLGLMLILVFAWQLRWLPSGQVGSLDHAMLTGLARGWDSVQHLILPVFVLGAGGAASMLRFVRAGLLEALTQEYVRAARARGLSERRVVLRHALRNALLPAVTLVGLSIPGLVGGAVVIEHLFSWPGMGNLTIEAIGQRDYPVIMATTFVSGVVVVLANLLTDIAYGWLDPRVRLES